jgi:hypothetical protein
MPTIAAIGHISAAGDQTLPLRNPNLYEVTVHAALDVSGATLGAHAKRADTVVIGSGATTIRASKTVQLRLRLTRVAVRFLRAHRTLKVTLRLTVAATGHRSKAITRRLTLHS